MKQVTVFLRPTALLLSLALPVQPVAFASPARRQSPVPTTLTGPVPSQIAAAHTIFLANSGADPNFPIDSTRAYNDLYAAIQARGRYKLVDSPAQADLIFQLHDVAPITDVSGTRGGIYTVTSPAFQLTIVDPKSNNALWTITSPVTLAGGRKKFDYWVAISETNLVSRMEVLAGDTLTPTETADLTTIPKSHLRRNAIIIVSAAAAVGVGTFLIFRHEVANQKASQDAFCTANHIPLSMCAGG